MRDELLNELENEYAARRMENERTENARREEIRLKHPDIERMMLEREQLIHGVIRGILNGNASGEKLPDRMEQINRNIRQALIHAGLSEDYLEPVYNCSICRDRGYLEKPLKEPCQCLKKAYQQKLRAWIGLNSSADESFEKYDADRIPDRAR